MIAGRNADWCGGWRWCPDGLGLAGVLASSVPRDVIDDVIEQAGKGARRSGGLPPHVMVYVQPGRDAHRHELACERLDET
jgi:hypothetical protein